VLVAALLGGVVGHDLWQASNSRPFAGLNPGGNSPSTSTGSGAPANAGAIAAAVDSCLVDVNTQITAEGVQGAGTGMVLSANGIVLTNNHVVESANRISVTDIGNGKVYDATVLGYDRSQDIAVLQLAGASGLQTCAMGDSSKLSLNDGVVAVGNANGAGGTPSYAGGSITALDQTITASDEVDGSAEQLTGLIQTNAGIVAGDSGGPLVGTDGKVIGMDTAASGGFQFASSGTQGYAIPINQALAIAHQITSGTASSTVHVGPTAYLGVGVRTPSTVFGGSPGTAGAQIVQTVQGGPADQAGLVVGDVITNLDGHSVASPQGLTSVMINEKPGKSVSVSYVDTSGQQHTTTVVLASGPPQ
jgi:S1-C subfamily serine protease